MAKRKKNHYRPVAQPTHCSQCGSQKLNAKHDTKPEVSKNGATPPFFCADCRARCLAAISKERNTLRDKTMQLAAVRNLSFEDNRTERWLETRDDIVRQSRATPQLPWMDTPSEEIAPAPSQKPRRLKSCLICKISPREVNVRLRTEAGRRAMIGICAICAKLASENSHNVRVNVEGNGNTVVEAFTLTQCPGCYAPVIESNPLVPCPSCAEDAISAARKLADGPTLAEELRALLVINPAGSCRRCNPQSRAEPYDCPLCRHDYRTMPGNQFPAFAAFRAAGTCCVCGVAKAAVAAMQVGERDHFRDSICVTCARIACHHPLKHRRTGQTVRLSLCEGCGVHRNSLGAYGLCPTCGNTLSALQRDLTELCDYLWAFLETQEGETPPPPPVAASRWLRADSTTRRADAPVNGRLNQHLSREICREYVEEEREIPELAIRFGVPATTVRNVLRGKTWAKRTEGVRPGALRDEPYRTRRPVERPLTITVTRLKQEMGWTDELIKQNLGDEDVRLRNPHYSSSAPMRLYRVDRVTTTTQGNPTLQKKLAENVARREARRTTGTPIG